jgi:hypothetical protein
MPHITLVEENSIPHITLSDTPTLAKRENIVVRVVTGIP